jgi:hypothetical protein
MRFHGAGVAIGATGMPGGPPKSWPRVQRQPAAASVAQDGLCEGSRSIWRGYPGFGTFATVLEMTSAASVDSPGAVSLAGVWRAVARPIMPARRAQGRGRGSFNRSLVPLPGAQAKSNPACSAASKPGKDEGVLCRAPVAKRIQPKTGIGRRADFPQLLQAEKPRKYAGTRQDTLSCAPFCTALKP